MGCPMRYGLAYPLLLTPSGAKFGKSEGGDSVWLHPDGTSPYAFYQHWLNTDDRDTSIYLRWFTLFEPERIEALEAAIASAPGKREAQRELAFDITARVHGADVAGTGEGRFGGAVRARAAARPGAARDGCTPGRGASRPSPPTAPRPRPSSPTRASCPSRGEARRLIQNGGLTINGEAITDPAAAMPAPIAGEWWDVRIGKRRREIGRAKRG